jgi:hypothetical protein
MIMEEVFRKEDYRLHLLLFEYAISVEEWNVPFRRKRQEDLSFTWVIESFL